MHSDFKREDPGHRHNPIKANPKSNCVNLSLNSGTHDLLGSNGFGQLLYSSSFHSTTRLPCRLRPDLLTYHLLLSLVIISWYWHLKNSGIPAVTASSLIASSWLSSGILILPYYAISLLLSMTPSVPGFYYHLGCTFTQPFLAFHSAKPQAFSITPAYL